MISMLSFWRLDLAPLFKVFKGTEGISGTLLGNHLFMWVRQSSTVGRQPKLGNIIFAIIHCKKSLVINMLLSVKIIISCLTLRVRIIQKLWVCLFSNAAPKGWHISAVTKMLLPCKTIHANGFFCSHLYYVN